jgi:hypothetical protein
MNLPLKNVTVDTFSSLCLLLVTTFPLILRPLSHQINIVLTFNPILLCIIISGERLGKLAALFPVMYLSGGTCVTLIITGGGTMKQLFKILCENDNGVQTCSAHSLSGVEWFLVFTCAAILIAQLPNLNSMTVVSLVGAVIAISYCTLFWSLSVKKGRPVGVSYSTTLVSQESLVVKISDIINAIGIIVLAFRGHNVVLEIQVILI